jgi:superfamily II DNA helicase RecQ
MYWVKPLLPLGPIPRFTSPEQAEAIQTNLTDRHILYIAATGSGKSLIFLSAPLIFPDKMFVVITPLVALTDDLARRLAATSIEGGKWHDVRHRDPFQARLVLVSAHEAGHYDFFRWANSHQTRIRRIFIDEAHHIITANTYRDCFKLFELITGLAIPITFLSATVFPKSVPTLCDAMRIDPALLHVIRTPTTRPNIQYTRTKCESTEEMMGKLDVLFRTISLSEKERGLIFCTKIDNCKVVAERLGISYYVANIVEDDPAANLAERKRLDQQWRDGRTASDRWMVATLCFGQGINVDHVRWVIHMEVSNLMNYAQETGRAGRDGLPARAHLFYTHLPPLKFIQDKLDHAGVWDMRDFLEIARCRRLSLHGPTDGAAHSCAALTGALFCDWCDDLYQVSVFQAVQARSAYEWMCP